MIADRAKEDCHDLQSHFGGDGGRSLRAVGMEVGGEGWGGNCGTRTFLISIESRRSESILLESGIEGRLFQL